MDSRTLLLHHRRAVSVSSNGRDPRAAYAPASGRIVVPETCGFYGGADAISRCRAPRSCQDCLATPGCGITSNGQCANVTTERSSFGSFPDYRNATFVDGSLLSNTTVFVFVAGSATYCAASDPVCVRCREEVQQIVNASSRLPYGSLGTQFCKGDNGCVCIGICEAPEQRTSRVLDPECDQPNGYHAILPEVVRDIHSVKRRDPRTPNVPVKHEPQQEESCAYMKEVDIRGCRAPRTCQSCLQKPGCTVKGGECIDMNSYQLSFRDVDLDSNSMGYAYVHSFPSSNTTYCPLSDTTCAACRKLFDTLNDGVSTNSRFCVGQDGCVCIQACEDDGRSRRVDDPDCKQIFGYTPTIVKPASTLGIAVATWLVLSCIYWCFICEHPSYRRQNRPRGRRRPLMWRNMLDQVPVLAQMDLFGWRAYREELLFREQERLQGLEVSWRMDHPVDFERMGPSAPDFDDKNASAPTAHDPKALASAPVYRTSFHDSDGTSDGSRVSTDDSTPSAPDFEEEEWLWERRASHTDRQSLTHRSLGPAHT